MTQLFIVFFFFPKSEIHLPVTLRTTVANKTRRSVLLEYWKAANIARKEVNE